VARAAAVEESLVESIAAGARAAGLALDTITVADSGVPLALLPGPERAIRARAERRRVRLLGAAAAGTWALVAALFLLRLAWERRAVERELTRLAAPLAAVLAARREVRDVEAALAAIARADRERSHAVALLAAVTAALPDSSVLTSLTWRKDGSTILSGAARQAAEVASRLDRVPGLAAPRFDGPVVRERIAGREWERFTIVFGGGGGRGRRDGL
jgi:Tfp pilus assembly protein PilN